VRAATVSVVIPVKNGARYLEEVLNAVLAEGPDEVLVIDSGSCDRSLEIAHAAAVRVLEIEPSSFAHGRTRNLAAEQTSGELICFITQDATPVPGWLDAYRQAFALDKRVGAAYGPHLPRTDTSPMIARELTEFFASFSADGALQLQDGAGPAFLSNANAAYRRECWQQIHFRDVAYSEDQAFGRDMLAAGWLKVYQPGAAVLHAHDYGVTEFMRRYFDEYRGLRQAAGHVERVAPLDTVRYAARETAADARWLREQGAGTREILGWTGHSLAHHGGRRVFSALGSRAHRLPEHLQRRLSLEGTVVTGAPAAGEVQQHEPLRGEYVKAKLERHDYAAAFEVMGKGPVPLRPTLAGLAERERLRIAMLVPPFSRGSGGHNTLFQIFSRLEQRGHVCSVWMVDYLSQIGNAGPSMLRDDIVHYFSPINGAVYKDFKRWHGADVVLATGWQTVHPALRLGNSYARAYMVNDHEPDFYPVSTERVLAADTYGRGLHCIAASPWLRDLLIERYRASADAFQLGVDHETYQPRDIPRRVDTVIYYSRHETGRRAVPIGLRALEELHRRRPDVRIMLFGSDNPVPTSFPHEHMGILSPKELSWLYSEATVGLCLSLTNFSLMPQEMLACGLPCVELAGVSAESVFGPDGPIELAPLDPAGLAGGIERLLDDPELRRRRSVDGIEFAGRRTWEHATDEVEAGLRHALALRALT
jgi:GT2 family glycosyltransferase/glycosyltransferase involved in cell wall biosynthesis